MKYIECYSGCNCSASTNRKSDLPGYCGTHGGDRKRVYGPLLPKGTPGPRILTGSEIKHLTADAETDGPVINRNPRRMA